MKELLHRHWALGIWLIGLASLAAETLFLLNRIEGVSSGDDLVWFVLIAVFAFVTIGALILSAIRGT
jgi:hypothetical protein